MHRGVIKGDGHFKPEPYWRTRSHDFMTNSDLEKKRDNLTEILGSGVGLFQEPV
jgi:hypothetical protein